MSSSQIFSSDEQTTDKRTEPTIQHLLRQNKMKDLALSKATNLIELLNIQLQVQRNSHQQNIRLLQQQLRTQYDQEISQLHLKIQLLQREIKNQLSSISSKEKVNRTEVVPRRTVLTRANSVRSLDKSKQSLNKKYTETLSNAEVDKRQLNTLQFSHKIYLHHIIEVEDWKTNLVQDLHNLIQSEYDDLEKLISSIENMSKDYQSTFNVRSRSKRNLSDQLSQIIRSQNFVINSLRVYSQQLQDMCKSANYKLNSLVSKKQDQIIPKINVQIISQNAIKIIGMKKQEWRQQFANLQNQNHELKSILDNMIKLVKEEKKIR